MPSKRVSRRGFTIVELMIAISVFSVASTLVIMGVLFVGRQYQQASNRTEIEEASRGLHQQLLQAIQYSSEAITSIEDATSDYQALCVGNQIFVYGKLKKVDITDEASYNTQKDGLYVINNPPSGCVLPASVDDLQNLLPEGAKVIELDVSGGTIKTIFAKSGGDLLAFDLVTGGVSCKMAVSGRQWCAVVAFESTGMRRLE